MLLSDVPCFFCLNPTSVRLGLDRKGRPYVHCTCCGARSFLPSYSPCLHGLAILGPLAHAIHEEMTRDRAAWERRHGQIATYLAGLRAQLAAAPAPPSAQPNGAATPNITLPVARPA